MEGLKSKFFIFINLYLAGTHFGDVKLVEEAGEVKGGHPDGVPDTWSCSTVQQAGHPLQFPNSMHECLCCLADALYPLAKLFPVRHGPASQSPGFATMYRRFRRSSALLEQKGSSAMRSLWWVGVWVVLGVGA